MAQSPVIKFGPEAMPSAGTLVVFAGDGGTLGAAAARVDAASGGTVKKAIKSQSYKGKRFDVLALPLPRGLEADTLLVVGLGDETKLREQDWARLGGAVAGTLPGGLNRDVSVFAERTDGAVSDREAADIAMGLTLRAYAFDAYKSKKDDDKAEDPPRNILISCADPAAATERWQSVSGVAEGVALARTLVNEPPNELGPVEFAERAMALSALGVAVRVMEPDELAKEEMRALLGVAQGSVRPARVAVMEWKGGSPDVKPVAFVGKGVVFDTGGISIKPAGGMEDMKGDMGGAAAVVGTMHALAARKAKVNAVGLIGLVENMPDGNAQRPGDIVKSKSGQTIEIINTDAEGRLVLADALTYTIETFSPRVVIDLATLTGAIIIALGHQHAGMYTDDDTVAAQLSDAGKATGDLVWRMPLAKEYDTLIDSKFADMKNTGGRAGGSITAAQFLKRFAKDSVWVHLDIAGTAFGAPSTEISRGFGSGFGVRLLDRFVADFYEDGADLVPRGPEA
ncbi:MAG: leucyl aminopeptidase [Pseudomonadota bacterium]